MIGTADERTATTTDGDWKTATLTGAIPTGTLKLRVTIMGVLNGTGLVAFDDLSLVLGAPPSIITQPSNQTVNKGQTATFTVVATRTAPISYVWQINTGAGLANIPSVTGSSYTIATTTLAMNGYQNRCVVTNSQGSATSNVATLTVKAPPTVTAERISISGAKGDSFWFIADKLGCAISELERLNNRSRFEIIYSGDLLRVPQS